MYTYNLENYADWPAPLNASEMINPYAVRVNADLASVEAVEPSLNREMTAQTYTNRVKTSDKVFKAVKFIIR